MLDKSAPALPARSVNDHGTVMRIVLPLVDYRLFLGGCKRERGSMELEDR